MGTQLQMLLVWVLEDLIPAEEIIKSKELVQTIYYLQVLFNI